MSYWENLREKDKTIIYKVGRLKFPAHFHLNLEFIYSLCNDYKVIIDGKALLLQKNQLLVIDSYSVHNILSEESALSLIIPVNMLSDFFALKQDMIFDSSVIDDYDKSFYDYFENFKGINGRNVLTQKAGVNGFLGMVIEKCKLIKSVNKSGTLVTEIIKYLNQNYYKNITLESLAKEFSYSKYTLSRIFAKHTGSNLRFYINNVRLNNFMEKFIESSGEINLSRLIEQCGFESPQTFYRVFKNTYGKSPKDFLKT